MRALLFVASISWVAAVACGSPERVSDHAREVAARAWNLLLAELDRELEQAGAEPADSAGVLLSVARSEAISDLTYYWLAYSHPHISDYGTRSFVAASRGEKLRALVAPADWGVVANEWRADTEAAARLACLELVSVLTDHSWLAPSARWPDDSMRLSYVQQIYSARELEPQRVRLRGPPRVTLSPDSALWSVDAWTYQPSWNALVYRYRCTLPRSSELGSSAYVLLLTDSAGPGTPSMHGGGPRGQWTRSPAP